MFSGSDNNKNMTCEEWLRDMKGNDRCMMQRKLINSDDIKKQIISESTQADNYVAYAAEALLCEDVKTLDAAKLEKAYEALKKNKFPENVVKSIEIMLAYLMYQRGAKMINAQVFTEIICTATQGHLPGLVILPKAVLHGLDFSVSKTPADFSYANLKQADVSASNMQGVIFKNANFYDAMLIKTNFQGCDLSGANLAEANLLQANFGVGQNRAKIEGIFLLPDTYIFISDEKFESFLEDYRILGFSEKEILKNIDKNFMNNHYSHEEKLHLYNKAFYHPCFNTKVGVFSISKEAQLCKATIASHIKALKANILARDERIRAEASSQNSAKK